MGLSHPPKTRLFGALILGSPARLGRHLVGHAAPDAAVKSAAAKTSNAHFPDSFNDACHPLHAAQTPQLAVFALIYPGLKC
jgi:hypothetical protein